MNKRAIVYLTTKTEKIDDAVIDLIRKQKQYKNTKIRFVFVRSQRIFNTKDGLTTLIEQYERTGIVYTIRAEIKNKAAFKKAMLSGIAFYHLRKNKINKWEIFRVGARNIKKVAAICC